MALGLGGAAASYDQYWIHHCNGQNSQARRKGIKGEVFAGPRRLGAPSSLKNTENGVPDGFFLTSNMHKIHFRPELRPGLHWRAYDAPLDP